MDIPLHIGLLTDSDAFAGTERHILDLALGLRERGSVVSIICPPGSPLACRARNESFSTIAMEKRDGCEPGAVVTLRHLLATGALDILHAHNGRSAFRAALAKTLSLRGHVVASQHFLSPAHVQRTGMRGAVSRVGHRWVNSTLDHVIAISEAVRTSALGRGGILQGKLTTVHNGIREPRRWQLRPPREVRAALGVGDAPLIVCAARLEPEKDVATLVRAIHRLAEPRPMCVIAGEGSERDQLETEIRCRRLENSVKLLGFQDDMLSFVNAANLFVLPSLAEPFGLAILEAMALGKPVIATAAGGPAEIIVDQSTGLLVAPANELAMADAIRCLIGNPARAAMYGENGRARFLERFTVDRMADSISAIYLKACGKGR